MFFHDQCHLFGLNSKDLYFSSEFSFLTNYHIGIKLFRQENSDKSNSENLSLYKLDILLLI